MEKDRCRGIVYLIVLCDHPSLVSVLFAILPSCYILNVFYYLYIVWPTPAPCSLSVAHAFDLTWCQTDQDFFYYWMTEQFVKQIVPAHPVMLLVDGHSSHYEPVNIQAASEQGIVVACLLYSCCAAFGCQLNPPIEVYWSEACSCKRIQAVL